MNERWIDGSVVGGLTKNHANCSFKIIDSFLFCYLSFLSFLTQEKYMWYCKKFKMWNFDCKSKIKKKQYLTRSKRFFFLFFFFMGRGGWDSIFDFVFANCVRGQMDWSYNLKTHEIKTCMETGNLLVQV